MQIHHGTRGRYFFPRLYAFVWLSSLFAVAAPNSAGSSVPPLTLPAHTRIDVSQEEGPVIISSGTTADDVIQEGWRRSLPPGLRNDGAPLHRIHMQNGVVVYILGSSHVSRTSCDDAEMLMEHVLPDVLFVELCSQRAGMLLDPPPAQNDRKRTKGKEKREKASFAQRGGHVYAKIQEDYAKKLNVTIGGEFRSAFRAAVRQQGQFWASAPGSPPVRPVASTPPRPRARRPCAVVLGDRPVRITLLRAWESLRFLGKVKLVCALLWSSLRQPSAKELQEWLDSLLNDRSGENDLITKAMAELGTAFPTLKRTIIEERDEFMVAKLRQTAELLMQSSDQEGEQVIVAVVGAGHCAGMLALLRQEIAWSRAELERWPRNILPGLLATKKKTSDEAEVASLVCDIIQFDYAYASQFGI